MSEKIKLENTRNADSRTADADFTMDDLKVATEQHIKEVGMCMDFFANKIHKAGLVHDWSKRQNFEEEYGPLCMRGVVDDEFKADPWYKKHIYEERHHINEDFKPDVNLIDVLEKIADTVSAGRGRAGHLTSAYMDIDPKLLYLAYWNTIKLLDDNVEVEDEEYRDYYETNE